MSGVGEVVDRSARVAAIGTHIAQLREDAEFLDGESASAVLAEVTALTGQLESLRLQLVSRIEDSQVWRDDVNATANSWLRARHAMDHRTAAADLRAARTVAAHPVLREAAQAGAISRAHIDTIVAIGEANPTRREHLGDFMPIFVDVARRQPVSTLKTVLRAWADQIDPLGTARDEQQAHSRRYLNVNLLADGVHIDGFFSHDEGAKVIAALNAALTQARRHQKPATAAATTPATAANAADAAPTALQPDPEPDLTPPLAPDLAPDLAPELPALSTAQQRADAFIAGIIDPMLASGQLPTSGGSRPAVTVLIPLDRLEQPCPPGPDDQLTPVPPSTGAPAVSEKLPFTADSASLGVTNGPGTALISAQTAQRLTCDCEIHRILINPDGLPLDVGRTMRTIPAHIRKALVVRDGGCVFPHCGRPPGWAEAHHIIHWAQGGRTSLDNAVLLCSKHHHKVHAEGHEVTIGPDGRGRVLVKSTRLRR